MTNFKNGKKTEHKNRNPYFFKIGQAIFLPLPKTPEKFALVKNKS